MRPGLWELSTSSDLLKLVPQLPPGQMDNLANMARQYGFELPQIENGAAISNTCITPEMAALNKLPDFYHAQSGCSAKNAVHTGSNYKVDYVCSGPGLKGSGTAEGSFTSPERFQGQTQFSGQVQGNPMNERADVSGRWISASCPAQVPAR